MSEDGKSVPLVTIVVQPQGEGSEPRSVQVDSSKFGFLSVQVQDEAYAQQYVNTSEVIADLSEEAVGAERAADIACTLEVAEGRTAITSVRVAAQTLRGADYLQLLEELYLEKVVDFFRGYLKGEVSTQQQEEQEVVPCVHTGQLMWDRLGAYEVLRLEKLGIISIGHKGVINASHDDRIDDDLLLLANTRNNVTSLDLSKNGGKYIGVTQFDVFADTLVTLVLSRWKTFDGTSLVAVARHGHLKHLDVNGTYGVIGDVTLSFIAQNCPLLQYLDVSETYGVITDTSMVLVAKNCPLLQHLDVSFLGKIGKITDTSISLVAQNCPLLQCLNVSCTDGEITDISISPIAQNCPLLQHLDVSCTKGEITDFSISSIAENCPLLQHLDVSCTEGVITDTSISSIAQKCPLLQYLDVSCTKGEITDTSILLVAKHCPNLQLLFVRDTDNQITGTSISAIREGCPQLQELVDDFWRPRN